MENNKSKLVIIQPNVDQEKETGFAYNHKRDHKTLDFLIGFFILIFSSSVGAALYTLVPHYIVMIVGLVVLGLLCKLFFKINRKYIAISMIIFAAILLVLGGGCLLLVGGFNPLG
ncbi:MAG: hypothetical protein WCO55_01855 [Candidatus Falkowbacteria bacterium]